MAKTTEFEKLTAHYKAHYKVLEKARAERVSNGAEIALNLGILKVGPRVTPAQEKAAVKKAVAAANKAAKKARKEANTTYGGDAAAVGTLIKEVEANTIKKAASDLTNLRKANDKIEKKIPELTVASDNALKTIAERKQALEATQKLLEDSYVPDASDAEVNMKAQVKIKAELKEINDFNDELPEGTNLPGTPEIEAKIITKDALYIATVDTDSVAPDEIEAAIEAHKEAQRLLSEHKNEDLVTLQAKLDELNSVSTDARDVTAISAKHDEISENKRKDAEVVTKLKEAVAAKEKDKKDIYSKAVQHSQRKEKVAQNNVDTYTKALEQNKSKREELQEKFKTLTVNVVGADLTTKSLQEIAQISAELAKFEDIEAKLATEKGALAKAKEEVKVIEHAADLGVTIDKAKELLDTPDIPTQTREARAAEERSDIAEMDRQREAAGIRPRAQPTPPPMSAQDARDVEEYERQRSVAAVRGAQGVAELATSVSADQERAFNEFANSQYVESGVTDTTTFAKYKEQNLAELQATAAKDVEYQKTVQDLQKPLFAKMREVNKESPKIPWEPAEPGDPKVQTIKDVDGNKICDITSTNVEENPPLTIKTAAGISIEVKARRQLELPRALEPDQGPRTMNLALKGADGRNMPKKDALYFSAQYDKDGKLSGLTVPEPIQFHGEGDKAVAFVEVDGKAFTLPVNRGELEGLQQEVARNRGLETSRAAEREAEAPALDGMSQREAPVRRTQADIEAAIEDLNAQEREAFEALKAASAEELAKAEAKFTAASEVRAADAGGRTLGSFPESEEYQAAREEVEAQRGIDYAIQQAILGGDRVDVALAADTPTGDALTQLNAIKAAQAAAEAELAEQIAADQQAVARAAEAEAARTSGAREAEARGDLEDLGEALGATVDAGAAALPDVGDLARAAGVADSDERPPPPPPPPAATTPAAAEPEAERPERTASGDEGDVFQQISERAARDLAARAARAARTNPDIRPAVSRVAHGGQSPDGQRVAGGMRRGLEASGSASRRATGAVVTAPHVGRNGPGGGRSL